MCENRKMQKDKTACTREWKTPAPDQLSTLCGKAGGRGLIMGGQSEDVMCSAERNDEAGIGGDTGEAGGARAMITSPAPLRPGGPASGLQPNDYRSYLNMYYDY